MLADALSRFVGDRYDTPRRMARLAAGQPFDPSVWREFAQMGLLGAALPEAVGGLGGGAVEQGLIAYAFGKGLVLEPFVASAVLAGSALLHAGQGARRDALLGELAGGSAIPVVAFVEPGARYRIEHCATTARVRDGGWALDGHKCVVLGGPSATHWIVAARTHGDPACADGITLFVLDREHPGLTRTDYVTMDDRPASDLRLRDVRVGDEHRLGKPGAGGAILARAVDFALAASLSEGVGAMDAALALTLDYLKTRQQFGRPLAAHQALQHRLVDAYIAIEESRVLARHAALTLDAAPAEAARQVVSAAKVLVGQAMRRVGQEVVQLHGAIGTTHEAPVSHYFKRLTVLRAEYGDADWHASRYAAALRAGLVPRAVTGVPA